MKNSQIIPKCTFIFFFLHTVLYCFHWEHQQVEGVQSADGGSLWYEGIGQIHNWYVILKEENLGFHLNINLSAIFENFSNYTQVYIHINFFLHTVLYCFHWEHQQVEGVQSAHGGSLWYEGIGQIHNWYVILKEENLGFHLNINLSAIFEKFSNYTQVYIHINFFLHTVLYCFHWEHQQVEGVQSADGGSLRFEGIGQIQNWCVILKEENLGFHLNINLSAIFENFSNYTQVYIHIFFHTVLYCFHWEHQQVEGVQSAHGGSLWYEGIGQIHNWYVILKEENLGFNLNMNLSAIFENFSNYTQVYIHIILFLHTVLYCFHWEN